MNLFLDLLNFLMDYCPLLMSIAILALIVILLSDSIKKHSKYYYIFFGIIAFISLIQYFNGLFEISSFNFFRVPILGSILRANFHMEKFGFPLLIIIMYMGALNPKIKAVKKLLKIRQELSLIVGCPVLCHSLIRVTRNFVNSLRFFSDREGFMTKNEILADQINGLTVSNTGYLLGILMLVVFLLLWITSFTSVHRSLGNIKWKKIQKWAYLLYAMLFLHSTLLHSGWFMSRLAIEVNSEIIISESISLASTFLIFSSYLYLRLKKAKADNSRHSSHK